MCTDNLLTLVVWRIIFCQLSHCIELQTCR
ncbi:hypothetical protein Nmel_010655 [Mimus melanotis]